MALRLSKALRNHMLVGGSVRSGLAGGKVKVYTGTQPTTANDAPTGTLLATFTKSSAAHTAEVRAAASVTLTGSGGQVSGITIGGVAIMKAAVPYNTSLTQTAADVAAMINASNSSPQYSAASSVAKVTILAAPGRGNVTGTTTTTVSGGSLGKTDVDLGTEVAGVTSVNGLGLGAASAGVVSKEATETWSGVVANTGVAGYFRFEAGEADSGLADSSERYLRLDGNVATSGANMNISNTNLTAGATETVNTFSFTMPEQ